MNYEQIKEIIKQARQVVPNKESSLLVDGFEEFISLAETVEDIKDPNDRYAAAEKIDMARDKVWHLLEKTAASFGLSMEDFMKYMENASHFSVDQWKAMQDVRQEEAKVRQLRQGSLLRREKRNKKAIKA